MLDTINQKTLTITFSMIHTNKPELAVLSNLTDAWQVFLLGGWRTYLTDSLKSRKDEELRSICAIKVSFQGTRGDESLHDPLFESVYALAKKILLADSMEVYTIVYEADVALQSRMRTYRGLFDRGGLLKQGNFIEHEIDFGKSTSLFVGIAKATERNIDEIVRHHLGSLRQFVLASDDPRVFSADFLAKTVTEGGPNERWIKLHRWGSVEIDYLNVVLSRCLKGDKVYRMGGDGGDREVSLQIFMERTKLDETLAVIKSLLGSEVREVLIGDQEAPEGFYDSDKFPRG